MRHLLKPQNSSASCVLAIGKFESIHRGHQALILEAVRLGQQLGLISAMIAFEPHPYRVLSNPDYKPMFTNDERAYIVQSLNLEGLSSANADCGNIFGNTSATVRRIEKGINYLLEYPFDAAFAALSPESFCEKLFDELHGKVIVVGKGYRFGQGRKGTIDTLKQIAISRNADVRVIEPQVMDGCSAANKISTSHIRALLLTNALQEAQDFLGFPFFIMGTVTQGRRIGHTIGFPTVNIYPTENKLLPVDGVYATQTYICGQAYKSITNIGFRPTMQQPNALVRRSVESYLIDFNGDAYGKELRTEFLRFIRPERRFANIDELRTQIIEDITKI